MSYRQREPIEFLLDIFLGCIIVGAVLLFAWRLVFVK
jgi:hypothetical protein